ncbi:MAG: hypothetical protein KDD98_01045 [Sphingomonadaceae bacterium]|nr:hypothetical protein [Sphingomonadaceae bacterium]
MIDNAVLISGILSDASPSGRLLALWQGRHFDIVVSERQFQELGSALQYPRLASRIVLAGDGRFLLARAERLMADLRSLTLEAGQKFGALPKIAAVHRSAKASNDDEKVDFLIVQDGKLGKTQPPSYAANIVPVSVFLSRDWNGG